MKHTITILSLLLSTVLPLLASTESTLPFSLKLTGRLLVDGGTYINSPKALHSGVNVTDLRLGAKLRIQSCWYTKIDVGFAGNKVSIKDAFTEYGKDGNYFRAGYMLGYYSIDQSNSTNQLLFNTGANVAETFYPGRRIGVSYTRDMPAYYLSAGAFWGDGLGFSETTKQGYNLSGRVVWRPVNNPDNLLHIGTGAIFRVPNEDTDTHSRQISLSSKGVTCLSSPSTLDLTIEDARSQVQANGECLLYHNRWMLQTEYMLTTIRRSNGMPSFTAHGGYVTGGFLLKGSRYAYDSLDALPVMPQEPHSLLLVCRYNYTNLNDSHSNLMGGSQHDISIGINYYLNKYISSRLNYAHLWLDKYSALGKCTINILQLRLQVRF
jgi:phosphate-selective porin OprO and OprP